MADGVVMNVWPWLSQFTDAELEKNAEGLRDYLKTNQSKEYEAHLRGELHWTEWHLKTRREQRNGSE